GELAGVMPMDFVGAALEVAVVERGDLAAPALDVDTRAVVREVEALAIGEARARRRAGADHDRARVALAARQLALVGLVIEILAAVAGGLDHDDAALGGLGD